MLLQFGLQWHTPMVISGDVIRDQWADCVYEINARVGAHN